MTKSLTSRQEMILHFILGFIEENGYPPTIREIGQKFKIGSLRGVTVHLHALEKKGCITRSNLPRSIRVIHPGLQVKKHATMLPLIGQIAAGSPILAQEHVESLVPVPTEMVRNIESAFLLRVRGDSMTGSGIHPRDLVVVKPQQTAMQGDLVAVMVEDEAAVKYIHFDGPAVRLISSNPAYDPIVVNRSDVRIVGRIVGLLRDYEGMAF